MKIQSYSKKWTFCLTILFFFTSLNAQISVERSVQISAEYDKNSGFMQLSWVPVANTTSYEISLFDGIRWKFLESLLKEDSTYLFTGFEVGKKYEIRIKKDGGRTGYGYIELGHEIPAVVQRGRCLLIIEKSLTDPLTNEIGVWAKDIEGDGWVIDTMHVAMDMTPPEVRTRIQAWYEEDTEAKNDVFLLGHVPVPYSGQIAPDGHTNHRGAWPADVYYAEMNGRWDDKIVNDITASDPRNRNIPGDGKFDNSAISTSVELEVGRVDMYDLPAFPDDYVELTRQYLNKNHAFRNKEFDVKRRGLIENNFASFAEGFGQNGWKNFTPMFGPENVVRGNYDVDLVTEDYMFAYACGGGSNTSMGGVGNTNNLYVEKDIQAVFVMNFGSYFGDWDKQNNLMRAALASGKILTNAWAARPNWQFHTMALGENVGACAKLSQNNSFVYESGFSPRSVHVALLGDPTLRLHTVIPPKNLEITEKMSANSEVRLNWGASTDANEGYLVLRRKMGDSEFELRTSEAIKDTFYTDSCLVKGEYYEYQVRSVVLEKSASGTYYNTSVGNYQSITTQYGEPELSFTQSATFEQVEFMSTSTLFTSNMTWDFGDGSYIQGETQPMHQYENGGTYLVCLRDTNDCDVAIEYCDTIEVESSLPSSVSFEIDSTTCYNSSDGKIVAITNGGENPINFEWSNMDSDSIAENLTVGTYYLTLKSSYGAEMEFGPIEVGSPDSLFIDITTTPSNGNDGTVNAQISGGTSPYTLKWGDGTLDPMMLPPGNYTLTVTDNNNCEKVIDFEITMATSISEVLASNLHIFPNPAHDFISLQWQGEHELIEFELINAQGQIMTSWVWNSQEKKKFLIKDYPNGIYILKGKATAGSFMKQVVIE